MRDSNLKFHFGNINLSEGLSTVDADGETVSGNVAFNLQDNSTIDIDAVRIVSLAKDDAGYQVYNKSTANITHSSIFLGGDNSTAIDAENSTLYIKNLDITLQPAGIDKSTTIAYMSENTTLNIEDSLLKIEAKGQSQGLGFLLDGGVTNITNSNIENNTGDVVIFTNKQDPRDETNNYDSTTVNLKNTKVPDAKVLVGLNMPELALRGTRGDGDAHRSGSGQDPGGGIRPLARHAGGTTGVGLRHAHFCRCAQRRDVRLGRGGSGLTTGVGPAAALLQERKTV